MKKKYVKLALLLTYFLPMYFRRRIHFDVDVHVRTTLFLWFYTLHIFISLKLMLSTFSMLLLLTFSPFLKCVAFIRRQVFFFFTALNTREPRAKRTSLGPKAASKMRDYSASGGINAEDSGEV